MTPIDFAKALRCTADEYEKSWNGSKYNLSFEEAAKPYFEKDWITPVALILHSGYTDIWDWCDTIDPVK